MKGQLRYLSCGSKIFLVHFCFLVVSKCNPLFWPDYSSADYQTRIEPNCIPAVRGFIDNCVIIKTMLIERIMVAFSCCDYFFSYYLEKFDHQSKAGRLLITFTFPSVYENCPNLIEWEGFNILLLRIWRLKKLLAKVEKIIIAAISEYFGFQSKA